MHQTLTSPEGVPMRLNTVQGELESMFSYCPLGHRRDGINYPTPGGGCTACIYESAGLILPTPGLPVPDADPSAILRARIARQSQPDSGASPLYR